MEHVPLRTPEQAAKTAERHNKKLAQRFPLLAEQLDTVGAWTPEKVLNDERRWREKMDNVERRIQERGDEYRRLIATRMTPGVLAEYDDYFRRVLPQEDAGYWADYWWQALRDLWPEKAQCMCPNERYHATFAKFEMTCRTCGGVLTPASTVTAAPVDSATPRDDLAQPQVNPDR